MANGIRTSNPCGFNKGHSSKFCVGFRVRQTPEKLGGHIRRNVVEMTIKTKTIVRKLSMIKINKIHLKNLDRIASVFCGYKDKTINAIISAASKITQNEYKIRHDCEEGDPLGIVQEIEIGSYEQMVNALPRIPPSWRMRGSKFS